MNKKTFETEMEIAEIHGNESEKRGLNWVIISFALIILTIIVSVLAASILSVKANQTLNQGSNSSGAPTQQK